MNYDLEAIGPRIRQARLDKGLSQTDLAIKANLDRSGISEIEGNKRRPALDTFVMIAKVLGVELDYLLGGGSTEPIDERGMEFAKYMSTLKIFEREVLITLFEGYRAERDAIIRAQQKSSGFADSIAE